MLKNKRRTECITIYKEFFPHLSSSVFVHQRQPVILVILIMTSSTLNATVTPAFSVYGSLSPVHSPEVSVCWSADLQHSLSLEA